MMGNKGMASPLKLVQLWGGAAEIAVPKVMIDMSDIRPVPDNQEVYMNSDSGQALVIEIVEPVKPPAGESIAAFCFQDLAQVSGACVKEQHTQTLDNAAVPELTDAVLIEMVSGTHTVSDQDGGAKHDVHVVLAVIRLQGSNGDIIMMLSTPEASNGVSANQMQLFTTMCKGLRFNDRSLLS
ncbi:g9739 [Coccomyxa viridis]|uniref:G9739 protein n=1 Tax=Coccomyxa viridis TaxID=1274662 RepID=A0ABP1G512_9CHLO